MAALETYFTLHVEACADINKTILAFRRAKKRVGLAIKPGTPVETLIPYLPELDLALVMTVEPGWGGQVFMQEMLDKVRALRREIDRQNLDVRLQVDGGINSETAIESVAAGADVLVAGFIHFCARPHSGGSHAPHDVCLGTVGLSCRTP